MMLVIWLVGMLANTILRVPWHRLDRSADDTMDTDVFGP